MALLNLKSWDDENRALVGGIGTMGTDGRRGGGAVVYTEVQWQQESSEHYETFMPDPAAETGYDRIFGIALRTGDGGVWSDPGFLIASFKTVSHGFSRLYTSLETGTDGDLVVYAYADNQVGVRTLLGTIAGALADPDIYQYLVMRVHFSHDTSEGEVQIWISDPDTGTMVEQLDVTGVDTGQFTWDPDSSHTSLVFGPLYYDTGTANDPHAEGDPCYIAIDDYWALTETGTHNNASLGDRPITLLVPWGENIVADGSHSWQKFPTTGGNHYDRIDEQPYNSDTDYIFFNTNNTVAYAAFYMSQLGHGSAAQVPGAKYLLWARKTDAATSLVVGLEVRDAAGAVISDPGVGDITLPNSLAYMTRYIFYDHEIGGAASSPLLLGQLHDSSAGVRMTTASASNEARVSAVYIEVIWPAASTSSSSYIQIIG